MSKWRPFSTMPGEHGVALRHLGTAVLIVGILVVGGGLWVVIDSRFSAVSEVGLTRVFAPLEFWLGVFIAFVGAGPVIVGIVLRRW
jgi:hypothetical protein